MLWSNICPLTLVSSYLTSTLWLFFSVTSKQRHLKWTDLGGLGSRLALSCSSHMALASHLTSMDFTVFTYTKSKLTQMTSKVLLNSPYFLVLKSKWCMCWSPLYTHLNVIIFILKGASNIIKVAILIETRDVFLTSLFRRALSSGSAYFSCSLWTSHRPAHYFVVWRGRTFLWLIKQKAPVLTVQEPWDNHAFGVFARPGEWPGWGPWRVD